MSEQDWTPETLKAHFDQMFRDRDQAVAVAIKELERRLSALNNAHEVAREKERDFYSRETHDSYASQISEQFDALNREILALQKPKWQVWIAAAGLTIGLIIGQWTLAIQPYENRIKTVEDRQKEVLALHAGERITSLEQNNREQRIEHENIKALNGLTNDRIDKLYELFRDLNERKYK